MPDDSQPLPVELVRKVEEAAADGQQKFARMAAEYATLKANAHAASAAIRDMERAADNMVAAATQGASTLSRIKHITRDWLRPAGGAGFLACLAVLGCGVFGPARPKPEAVMTPIEAANDGMAAARLSLRAKDYEGAAKLFAAARENGADPVATWEGQANAWYSAGNDPEAMACVRELKRLPGGKGFAFHIEGAVCERSGRLDQARHLYAKGATEGCQYAERALARVNSAPGRSPATTANTNGTVTVGTK